MKIIIGGSSGEGKTTISKLISDTLEKNGFQVENKDPDILISDGLQDKRLEILKDNIGTIEIESIQTISNGRSGPRRVQHHDTLLTGKW